MQQARGALSAKGERWVSPGVGERMIEYLKRTYGGQAKRARRRAQRNFNFDRLAPSVTLPGANRRYPRQRACDVCGAEYTAVNAQHIMCASCADAQRLARKREYNRRRRGAHYPCQRPCSVCGAPIVAHSAGQVRCPACQHAYELEREQQQRDARRGGPRTCRQCGVRLGDVHRNERFCSTTCRREHRLAYKRSYNAAHRGVVRE